MQELTDVKSITEELYKANANLLNQKRRSERLLYSVAEAVIAVDDLFTITIFNKTAEVMTGLKADDVLGSHIDTVIKLTDKNGANVPADFYCAIRRVKNGEEAASAVISGAVVIENLTLVGPKKTYVVNLESSVIKQALDKTECIITLSDITKEKEMERAKDDFLSLASHSLRTPMTIIKSYLWMLQNNKAGPLNEKQGEYLGKAVNSTNRMISQINDMLDLSRMEQGRMTFKVSVVNVKDCMQEAIMGFDLKTGEKGLYLKHDFDKIDPELRFAVDENKTKEVVSNLMGNSVKFTKTGGIDITTEIIQKEDAPFIKISIKDTGTGIEQENLSKLFKKFERLDNSYTTVAETAGTGLGLYISKLYIEKMGGQVGATSDGSGKGTTFWLTLPICTDAICSLAKEKVESITMGQQATA